MGESLKFAADQNEHLSHVSGFHVFIGNIPIGPYIREADNKNAIGRKDEYTVTVEALQLGNEKRVSEVSCQL